MESRLIATLNKVKGINQDADIFVSTILPRQDYKNHVVTMNSVIRKICKSIPGVKLVDNQNIAENTLIDRKHINRDGFRQLLAKVCVIW